MKDTERRGYEMLVRVDEFFTSRTVDFPSDSMAGTLLTSLREQVTVIEDKASQQSVGFNTRREGTTSRAIARENLRDQMEAISRTAASLALADTTPGIEDRFRMPRGSNDQSLINAARAFATEAEPIKRFFIGYGLPPNFIDTLMTSIAAFEEAIARQNSGRDTHVSATTAIDGALERGINLVRQLDAIVRNKYRDQPPQLAAWESASHIERSPRRAEEEEPEQPNP